MRDIFLVTGAIYGKAGTNGLLDPATRIQQTIDTAVSIKQHLPNAVIYLIEGGSQTLDLALRAKFLEYYTDILDFSYHPFIAFAHNQIDTTKQEITVIKGPCETFLLRETCKLLSVTDDDRIYKISGRYRLTDAFNPKEHHAARGKYLMLAKTDCLEYYSDPNSVTYSPYQYSTRLYSFCGSIINRAIENYNTMNERLLNLCGNLAAFGIGHE